MLLLNPILFLLSAILTFLIIRFFSRTAAVCFLRDWWQFLEDKCQVYQFYRVPQFNQYMQENQLYRKVYTYLNSLPAVEHSDFANLFSGAKSNEINLLLDANHTVVDNFLGARLFWINETDRRCLILKIKKRDKRRILRPYIQHIHGVFDEIEHQNKEIRLFVNIEDQKLGNGRWTALPFTHPATLDTVVMESDLKNKVKSDLESFLKSKQYYNRLGRVWKRSYLLYGPSGTGKSTFIAAMAKFLRYDIYNVDLSRVSDDSDLKMLLLQTTAKSLVVIEDLDRFMAEKKTAVSISGLLNFMDGIISSCGEERMMVFTMNSKEQADTTVLRPGRIDVHLHFPLCDFNAFKSMANSHLGLKDHKLFPQVEEVFLNGGSLSPCEIGEIMIANRNSPSRALKSVISALQNNADAKLASRVARKLTGYGSARVVDEASVTGIFCKEIPQTAECRKLYGLFKRSSRRESMDLDSSEIDKEKENSRQGI